MQSSRRGLFVSETSRVSLHPARPARPAWRRLLAVVVAVLLLPALLPLPATAQGGTPTLTIQPPSDNELDVNLSDRIRISGSGFPAGSISAARLVAVRANGATAEQAISGLNSPSSETASYLRNDDGTISGAQRLSTLYANPREDWCLDTNVTPPAERVLRTYLEVTVSDTSGSSNVLEVDFCQPRLLRYDVTGPQTIRAVFSEPVHYGTDGLFNDSGIDWDILEPSRVVTNVEPGTNDCANALEHPNRDGCTRILTLGQSIGEDTRPRISYEPSGRPSYVDYANGSLQPGSFDRMQAIDRIRPRKPGVVTLAGQAPAADDTVPTGRRVAGNDPTPQLEINSYTAGHTVEVRRGSTVIDTFTGTSRELPDLGADGRYDLELVAIDANGNRSTDVGSPSGQDGANNPVSYALDTTPPLALSATRTSNPRQVLVTFDVPSFNAPASGDEPAQVDAGRWTVNGVGHTAVARTEQAYQRLVTFPSDLPQDTDVFLRWAPDSANATAAAYTDAVGNAMAELTAGLRIQVPTPINPPVWTFPDPTRARTFTAATPVTVRGGIGSNAASDIAGVEVRIRGQETTVAGTLDGSSWSADVTLPADGSYTLQVRNRSRLGALSAWVDSSQLVRDTAVPVVTLDRPEAPEAGGIFGGGSDGTETAPGPDQEILFWVTDGDGPEDHLASTTTTITFDAGGVDPITRTTTRSDPGSADSPIAERFDIPEDYLGDVTVTVQATDRAGNTSQVASGVFVVIDAVRGIGSLVANAGGINASQILIDFEDAVTGQVAGGDFDATNGIDGGGSRPNTGGSVADGDATVAFSQPFPGGLSSVADENATPLLTYDPGLLSAGLDAGDNRTILIDERVRDVTPPATPTVASTLGRVASLDREPPAGTDCSQSPPPEGCPFVATFTGTTSGSLRPNLVTVSQLDADGQPGDVVLSPAEIDVDEDGEFLFRVPVAPNATSRFAVTVTDPGPDANPAPDFAIAEITEDSVGPVVSRLFASLEDAEEIAVTFTLTDAATDDQSGNTAALAYRTTGSAFTPIEGAEQVTVDAEGRRTFTWDVPDGVDLSTTSLEVAVVGTDALGNEGPRRTTGLGNLPRLASATAVDASTVRVTTTEPVATDAVDNAGFSIQGGPGVESAVVDGQDRILLTLTDELPVLTNLRVAYNGIGGWAAPDGRPLAAGSVPLAFGSLLPVTDLAAAPAGTDDVVLSFIDDRNPSDVVTGYEVSRDGSVITTMPASQRIHVDTTAPTSGTITYSVVVVGTGGARSAATTITYEAGLGEEVDPGDGGGTGAPSDSTVVEACRYTAQPNITAQGGTVLSCDGRVAALVPAGVASEPMFGAFVRRTGAQRAGYDDVTDLYQLVVVTAADRAVVDAFSGFVELSFRDLRGALADGTPELTTALRVADDLVDEQAPRLGVESLATQLVTLGTFRVVEAQGQTLRVYGPDPAITPDRFATSAALSQTQHRRVSRVVLARADDYPDALSAAPLAALFGGPILLTRTGDLPVTTRLELDRLQASAVVLVGGTAAIGPEVAAELTAAGFSVGRIGGATRFDTSAMVARTVGSIDGGAFLATGQNFADALAASAPAAALGRPVLLTPTASLAEVTAGVVPALGIDEVHIVGGEAAVAGPVADALEALGVDTRRAGGPSRTETAILLAEDLVGRGLLGTARPVLASGDGDGTTSPDALSAGPIGGRTRSPLLLTPRASLPGSLADHVAGLGGLRGILMAGGPAAITDEVRAALDAAR